MGEEIGVVRFKLVTYLPIDLFCCSTFLSI